jgi:tryptophanyl-tRNA synthetase
MYTDERHLRASDPGNVEGNVVFAFLDAFEPDAERVEALKSRYRAGGLGDTTIKAILDERLQALLAPIRERRTGFAADRAQVLRVLERGTEAAREVAGRTLRDVKRALGLSYFDRIA